MIASLVMIATLVVLVILVMVATLVMITTFVIFVIFVMVASLALIATLVIFVILVMIAALVILQQRNTPKHRQGVGANRDTNNAKRKRHNQYRPGPKKKLRHQIELLQDRCHSLSWCVYLLTCLHCVSSVLLWRLWCWNLKKKIACRSFLSALSCLMASICFLCSSSFLPLLSFRPPLGCLLPMDRPVLPSRGSSIRKRSRQMPPKTSWLGACRGPDGCRSRPTPCSVRPVSRCGFAPRPRTSVLDPPPVRLHNCASGRASFAKHALEPNPSRGGAQQGARAAKACPKWLGGCAPCSDENAFASTQIRKLPRKAADLLSNDP